MRPCFYIEVKDEVLSQQDIFRDEAFLAKHPIVRRYLNYGVVYEDFRTVIELNKTLEELLTHKYIFFKEPRIGTRVKKYKSLEALEYDVRVYQSLLMQSLFTTTMVTYVK